VRALAVALVLLAGCSRAPQEPAPAASTRSGEQTVVIPSAAPSAASVPIALGTASAAPCPPDPEALRALPAATISIPGAAAKLKVELARGAHDTERGLMYRTKLPEDEGMLFVLERRADHAFWMHNTCIPLDLVFIEDDGTIVGILEDLPTLNDVPRSVGRLSTHVLEVNAGWCRRHGVKEGQKLVLPPGAK
jgi:uncharacterized membrane protein (UPF0127 family)